MSGNLWHILFEVFCAIYDSRSCLVGCLNSGGPWSTVVSPNVPGENLIQICWVLPGRNSHMSGNLWHILFEVFVLFMTAVPVLWGA
jgi:hypothetical protein